MLIGIVAFIQLVSAIAIVVNAQLKLSLASGTPVISNQSKLVEPIAGKKEAKQSWLLEESVEDEPIVINSVHSGQINAASANLRRSPRPPRPMNSKRDPVPLINDAFATNTQQVFNLSQPTLEAKHDIVRTSNQYQHQRQQQQQQPSQEFDQQTTRSQQQFSNNSNRNLWSTNKQQVNKVDSGFNQVNVPRYQQQQQQQQPGRDYYGVNAAPYAVTQQNQATQQVKQQQWFSEHHQQQTSNLPGQLIRDTSQLQAMNNAIAESDQASEQFATSANEPHHQQHLQSTWMQSMRDNHHGPLRSRHNLTYANHRFTGDLSPARTSVVALGGNAHLFDGHMKAKPGPSQLVPYEQQAKSVRNQAPLGAVNTPSVDHNASFNASSSPTVATTTTTPTSFDNLNSFSRRNSKFTRDVAEMTTPVDKESFGPEPTVTANHHAPSAEARKRLATAAGASSTTTPATTTTTSAAITTTSVVPKITTTAMSELPPQARTKVTEEPATGNGHIVALNETDLLILGQKLGEQQSIGQKIEDRLDDSTQEVVQVLENHHNKQVAARKVLNDDNQFGELVVSNNHSNSSKYGNMKLVAPAAAAAARTMTTVTSKLGAGGSAKQARRMFSSNKDREQQDSVVVEQREDSSSETKQLEAETKSSASSRSWSRLLPTLLQRTLGSVFRRLTGVQQTATSSQASNSNSNSNLNSNTASSSSIWTATHQAPQQQSLPQSYQLLQFNSNSATPNFQAPQTGSLNFLTSALSAAVLAASAASRQPNKQQQASSISSPNSANNLDQIDLSNSMLTHKQHDTANSNVHETRHPPRQHANKKIIDSFIDLPVSERRQTIERRDGSSLVANNTDQSERIESRAVNDVAAEPLEAEPRYAELDLKGVSGELATGASRHNQSGIRKVRSSKTSSEWKGHEDDSKNVENLAASDSVAAASFVSDDYANLDYETDSQPKRGAELLSAAASSQLEVGQPTDNESNDEGEKHSDMQEIQEPEEQEDIRLDFRTTSSPVLAHQEPIGGNKRVSGGDNDNGDTEADSDSLESADSIEDRLYSVASDLGETPSSQNNWQLDGPAETGSEEQDQSGVFYYAPQSGLNSRPSRKEYEIVRPLKRGPSQTATRHKSGSVIEPSVMYGHDAPEVDQRRRPTTHQNKRKRPSQITANQVYRRKPGELVVESANSKPMRQPMVPPISVLTAKRGPQSSIVPKPISIFASPPNLATAGDEEASSGSNMMSPMSSSINVMDLDPSLTRLAHNKLIVAKFRPKRYKLKTKPTASVATTITTTTGSRPASVGVSTSGNENNRRSPSKPSPGSSSSMSTSTSTSTTTATPPVSSSTTLVPLPSANRAMDRKPFVDHPAISSLTSAILGTQVMSNNHINDIISRWTRPSTANQNLSASSNGTPAPAPAVAGNNNLGHRSVATPGTGAVAQASSLNPHSSPSKPQAFVDSGTISSETGGANRRMPDPVNGLRIMSDLQHLMPFASNLAARFSFPTTPQHSRQVSSTTTTTTTPPPTSSSTTNPPNLSSAYAANHRDYSIATNNQLEASSSSSSSSQNGISKNDKFNFSLINMNNRERVNPLLFPTENQRNHFQQMASNSSLNKKLNNVRTRLTPTSTTMRPTRPPSNVSSPVPVPSSTTTSSSTSTTTSTPSTTTSSTTTTSTTTTTTTRPPTVPQKSEQSQSNGATSPLQSSSMKPPQRSPVYHPNRAPPTRSTIRKPSPTTPSDKEIGQTLRSQHQVSKPHTKPSELDRLRNQYLALIGKNSTLDGRQQQQEVSEMVAPSAAPNLPTTSWTNELPGHITLVSSSLLSNDAPLSLGQEATEDGAQDANKYLTFGTPSNSSTTYSSSSSSGQAIESDHSIVIMSDNHNQLRRRPSSSYNRGPSSRPFISTQTQTRPTIFYSSLSPKSENIEYTTLPPLFTDYSLSSLSSSSSLNPAQIARKYLEEFVNGSRIRPSSAAAVAKTTVEPKLLQNSSHVNNNWQFNHDQQQQQQHTNDNLTSQHDLMPLLVVTNHRLNSHNNNNNSQSTSLDVIRRQTDSNNAKFNYSYQIGANKSVLSSANGSPAALDPSSGLLGKLDHRAEELLLDIFDRDPSYSDSVLFTQKGQQQQQQANVGNSSSFIDLLPSSGAWTNKSDILRRIYNAQMAREEATDNRFKPAVLSTNEYTNYNMQTTAPPPSVDAIGKLEAETNMNTRTNANFNFNSIRAQSIPITLNPIELKQNSFSPSSPPPEDIDTTQLSVETTSAGSDDLPRSSTLSSHEDDDNSNNNNNHDYTTTISSTSLAPSSTYDDASNGSRGDLDLGNPDDTNNRASMRKNQARIKEILAALAKKNADRASLTTSTVEPEGDLISEPLSIDQRDQQQGPNSMHFYTTSSVSPQMNEALAGHTPFVEKATTTPAPDISSAGNENQAGDESSSNNSTSDNEDSDHETTKFYAPFKLTTVAVPGLENQKHKQSLIQNQNRHQNNQSHRYPIVETLSSSRQKINRPSSSLSDFSSSSGSIIEYSPYHGLGASTPSVPQTTTKLTESLSTNDNLKQIIKNRVTGDSGNEHETSARPASSEEPQNQDLLQETTTEMPSRDNLDNRNELFGRPQQSGSIGDKIEDESSSEDGSEFHYPNLAGTANDRPIRPVIIRRKPHPKPNRRPATGIVNPLNVPHRITLEGSPFSSGNFGQLPNNGNKKRRRKPSRRPTTPDYSTDEISPPKVSSDSMNNSSYGDIITAPGALTIGLDEPIRKPTIVYKPKPSGLASGSAGLIRKRPTYVRLPAPDNIRIQGFAPTNKTIGYSNGKHKPSSSIVPPVSIFLPMESIINRKNQDIRTRPLTIIDPATESSIAGGDSVNESVVNPINGLTRIPETTIMHDKMVVTYKPGRPLPGSMSGFGTLGHGSPSSSSSSSSDVHHHHHHHHHHNRRPVTEQNNDNDSQINAISPSTPPQTTTTSATMSPILANNTIKLDSSLHNGTLPQLGSGNGGDTHLVSIEQQQAQMFTSTSRRPPPTTITIQETPTQQHETLPIQTTTPAYPSMIPHRPIIVINGLFDPPTNGSMPLDSSKLTSSRPEPQRNNKPHKQPNSGHSLIEAGSMTVVAHASHGQSNNNINNHHHQHHNTSRPWYPTVTPSTSLGGGSGSFQSNRPNNTFAGGSSNNNSSSNEFNNELVSSNQTADSVVGPDIPNFANPSSSSSASGSYQNHNHEQQQHNQQHIGMPHLGPGSSLPLGNRPGQQQKPYRWRVRRRPGSPTSSPSNADYNYTPTSTISTYVYRPIAGSLQQFFSLNTLINAYENVLIFFARLRTFLISFMVMFLPPIALAASVANAMSS